MGNAGPYEVVPVTFERPSPPTTQAPSLSPIQPDEVSPGIFSKSGGRAGKLRTRTEGYFLVRNSCLKSFIHALSGALVGSARNSMVIMKAQEPASIGECATPGNRYM